MFILMSLVIFVPEHPDFSLPSKGASSFEKSVVDAVSTYNRVLGFFAANAVNGEPRE